MKKTMSVKAILKSVQEKKEAKGTPVLGEARPVGSLQRSLLSTRAFRQSQLQEGAAKDPPKPAPAKAPEKAPEKPKDEAAPAPEGEEVDEARSTAAERAKKRKLALKRRKSGKRKDLKRSKAMKIARKKHKSAFAKGAKLAAKIRDAQELMASSKRQFSEHMTTLSEEDQRELVACIKEEGPQAVIDACEIPEAQLARLVKEDEDEEGDEDETCPECGEDMEDCTCEDDEGYEESAKPSKPAPAVPKAPVKPRRESATDGKWDPLQEILLPLEAEQVDKQEDDPLAGPQGKKTQDVEPGKQVT